jgi:hypothetical protein
MRTPLRASIVDESELAGVMLKELGLVRLKVVEFVL